MGADVTHTFYFNWPEHGLSVALFKLDSGLIWVNDDIYISLI